MYGAVQIPKSAATSRTTTTMADNSKRRANPSLLPQRYKRRAYGHSCNACRERKAKCEEVDNPPCKLCRETNTICEQVERRKSKKGDTEITGILAEFETRLRRLEAHAATSDMPRLPAEPVEHDTDESALGRPQYDLGSTSRPVYHGELSMFEDLAEPSAPGSPALVGTSPSTWTEERLRDTARLRHRYATVSEGEAWMDAYFSWASPVYAVVHRPIFIRDMALGGPYFSEFLLIVIYITGIRLTYGMNENERAAKGEQYVRLAMSMLPQESMGPGRITTIQALLGLSGRQSAVGNANQAWMLTGMAIRMMQDMGLHLPASEAQRFSTEDQDMRNRVFWSAYCWDKTMSLTFGREPSLLCRPGLSPDSLPEDPDDSLEWQPHLPPGTAIPLARPYPRTTLLKTFTLRYSSHLNIILESILVNMYSPGSAKARSLSFIRSAVDRLDTWHNSLPPELKIERPTLPALSPPANIVNLNLLYHTMRILIYRPLLTADTHSEAVATALSHCRGAATGTHDILSLWGHTFGHFCHHYLFLYCCFISAGVDILLIRTGVAGIREEALRRVALLLEILEQASAQGPGIRRGIANIRTQLDRATKIEVAAAAVAAPRVPEPFSMPQQMASVQQGVEWLDGDLWDHQALMNLLGTTPLSTEIPFAFGTDLPMNFKDYFSDIY